MEVWYFLLKVWKLVFRVLDFFGFSLVLVVKDFGDICSGLLLLLLMKVVMFFE